MGPRRRLVTDATFRAHVESALRAANIELERRTGEPMTEDEKVVATLAAAYAVSITERRLRTMNESGQGRSVSG